LFTWAKKKKEKKCSAARGAKTRRGKAAGSWEGGGIEPSHSYVVKEGEEKKESLTWLRRKRGGGKATDFTRRERERERERGPKALP